ncbi:hypothetical protein [Chamaesiphon sp.]|uniref:hypothetical protein n=1 Tax=Chamaesiphon sp. TaxID=2814140 RepID=UPI003593C249
MITAIEILNLSRTLKRIYIMLINGRIYIEFVAAPGNSELALTSNMSIDGIINLLAREFHSNSTAIRLFY